MPSFLREITISFSVFLSVIIVGHPVYKVKILSAEKIQDQVHISDFQTGFCNDFLLHEPLALRRSQTFCRSEYTLATEVA